MRAIVEYLHMAEHNEEDVQPQAGNDLSAAELAHQQALKYGEDLRRIYLAEKAKRQELELANQMLSAVFNSTPDGLVVLDDSLTIQQANPVFLQFLELGEEAVEGKRIEAILPYDELLTAIKSMTPDSDEAQLDLKITKPVTRSLLVSIARLVAGQLHGWVLVLHDQTERKRLEYQKIEFVNIAAHELRTPLSALIGLSEVVLDTMEGEDLDEDLRDCLRGIYTSGYRLANIVDELLAFAQISEGSISDESASVYNLANVFTDIIDQLESRASDRQITIHFDRDDADIDLALNKVLLRAALYQLILNGINFNEPGGNVYVHVEQRGEAIHIEIEDDGIGIPQSEIDAVFQPFFQVEEHNTRRVGGLGLGLPIVNRAINQLGGQLSVKSVLEKGTTFSIDLDRQSQPVEEPTSPDIPKRLEASHQQSLAYARDIQQLYKKLQEHFVETLATITEALEARDEYLKGHSERVTELSVTLGRRLGLNEGNLKTLEVAARVHDIGKIGMADNVLYEAHGQPEHQYAIVQHIEMGRRILTPLKFLEDALPIALAHHERYDGQGYPESLVGEEIPYSARILSVANDYDIMTSPRPHRPGLSSAEALDILQSGRGSEWDPAVVDEFVAMMQERSQSDNTAE